MPRQKDEIPSEFVRIQGRRKRGVSARWDKTFAYLDGLPDGKRFDFVWEYLTAAVNGELGQAMQEAVEEADIEKALEAARNLRRNFVDEDED